jgi:hypothetical protein
MKGTGLNRDEMYQLLASTGDKIQHATNQPDHDLRLLVLLCNTLDQNLPILQSTAWPTGYMYDIDEEQNESEESDNSDDSDDSNHCENLDKRGRP